MNVFDPGAATEVRRVKMLIFNAKGTDDAPFPCDLQVYNATVGGGPTGAAIYEQRITPTAYNVFEEWTFDTPVAVTGAFAVGCEQDTAETTNYFGVDDSVTTGSWLTLDQVSWTTNAVAGFPSVYLTRAIVSP